MIIEHVFYKDHTDQPGTILYIQGAGIPPRPLDLPPSRDILPRMRLILLRGPSGTGKSTIARRLADLATTDSAFHETDQFFVDEDGDYHFTVSKLGQAHNWNQLQVERSMSHGIPLVIVANTFIAHWEMERYLELAEEYNYEVEIIRTPGPWESDVLFKRNKHNVPLEVVKRHIRFYQPHTEEIVWSDMSIFK